MDFTAAFFEESLQSPWVIEPVSEASPKKAAIATSFAFIVETGLDDQAFSMLSKMILAIGLTSEEVSLVEVESGDVADLQMVGEPKKLMFFGRPYPGTFGQVRNWYGHQVVQTHSISDLVADPTLKKETWYHLKKYGSLF